MKPTLRALSAMLLMLAGGAHAGEPTFAHFKRVWGSDYSHAGVGSVIELP